MRTGYTTEQRKESGKGARLAARRFCLTLWSKMAKVMERANREGPVMGLISYADDFIVSSEVDEADRLWDETSGALDEIGLEIDQSKSCYTSKNKASWSHKTPAFKRKLLFQARRLRWQPTRTHHWLKSV